MRHAKEVDREEIYLTTEELAKRLKRSPGSLANDRALRKGIPYIKLGHLVLYRWWSDAIPCLEKRRIDPERESA